jgi:hypothetical protein
MVNVNQLKDELISRLWLPKAREAGSVIYPRRRRNTHMRMFTLSDGLDLSEVCKLEDANLIMREECVAWVCSMNKRWRVESENIGMVIDGHVYDPSFLRPSCPLVRHFPFDILNLDFGSQDTEMVKGRMETEMMIFERFIRIQQERGQSRFLVILTIPIYSCSLDCARVVRESNGMKVDAWGGLGSHDYTQNVEGQSEKTDFIQAIAEIVAQKYGYSCRSGLVPLLCSDRGRIIFSMAGVLVR